MEPRLYTHNFI